MKLRSIGARYWRAVDGTASLSPLYYLVIPSSWCDGTWRRCFVDVIVFREKYKGKALVVKLCAARGLERTLAKDPHQVPHNHL